MRVGRDGEIEGTRRKRSGDGKEWRGGRKEIKKNMKEGKTHLDDRKLAQRRLFMRKHCCKR